MSEAVIVAVIGGGSLIGSTIVTALLGFVLNKLSKISKDTKATTAHVVNDHKDRNFREESDARYTETLSRFEKIDRSLIQINDTAGALMVGWFEHNSRIDEIEDTINGENHE